MANRNSDHREPFWLLERSTPRKDGTKPRTVFYIQFKRPDGSMTSPVSSGQSSKRAARNWATERIKDGSAFTTPNREDVVGFLHDFWTYEGRYVQGRLDRGASISRNYVKTMGQLVDRYVKPTFSGRRIAALTPDSFDEWMSKLRTDGTPPRMINLSRQAVNVALNWLVALRRLPYNPLAPVKPFHETHERRAILTLQEFRSLLALEGLDPRVRAAIALGGLCGLRLGEIRALHWSDVDRAGELIKVHRSYVPLDGERDRAKHGSDRDVPLPAPVAEALDAVRAEAKQEPSPDAYVLVDSDTGHPMGDKLIRAAFYAALKRIKVDRTGRHLVFHGLRNWYITQLRGSLPEELLRRFAGHATVDMTDRYDRGRAIDFQKARRRMEQLARGKAAEPESKTRKRKAK